MPPDAQREKSAPPGAKTSVIVVNHNGGRALVDNLKVVSSELDGLGGGVVVVDNASTDGSPDLIGREVPGVLVLRETENRGYASGVNAGIRASDGDVLVVLNPDVTPEPGAIRRLRDAVLSRRVDGIVGGLVKKPDGSVDRNCERPLPGVSDILREGFFLRPRHGRRASTGGSGVEPVAAVSGSVMALTREAFERLGPMDEDFFLYREDVEWCRRARERGLGIGVARSAVFTHEGGTCTRSNELRAFAARMLSDFHYYCDIEGVPVETVRKRWNLRLRFRSFVYSLDARFGVLGRRPGSSRRASAYRLLRGELDALRWDVHYEGQACHPDRLSGLPRPSPRSSVDSRPRVMLVTPDLSHGGSQRRIEHMVTGELSERFDFEVLCLRELGEIGRRLEGRVRMHLPGVEDWRSRRTWRRLRDYCGFLDADLVYSATFPADLAARFGFAGRVPWISAKVSVDTWMSPWMRFLERRALRRAGIVYAVGDEIASSKSALSGGGMAMPVVPNPPMIPFSEGSPRRFGDGPVRVATLGRLEPVKRTQVLLTTAAELERRAPGRFEYEVVGGGSEYDGLRRMSEELGLDGLVSFSGPTDDVPAVLDRADIVPLFGVGEGNPNTVLETIARGRVPLVPSAGGAADALPDCLRDCVVASDGPEAFADAIEDIVSRPEHFLGLVEQARDELRGAGRAFAVAMTGLFNDALDGGGPRPDGRPRVLHIITRLIVGGAQENTIASVERVDPARFRSRMWIGPQTGSEGSLLRDARRRGIVVRILPNLVREISPLRDAAVTFQLVRLLRRGRYDIVHTHSSKAGIVGRLAARLAGVPHIVHTVHGWGFHERMHPLVKHTYVTLERIMQLWTDVLVSVSNRTTRIGLDEQIGSPGSYRMIRSGIPLGRFHPDDGRRALTRRELGAEDTEVVVGSVGRLSAQKNPLDFVDVAARLHARVPNVRFVYVGDGPMRDEVVSAAETAGIADRVSFVGLRADVPDLLRAMDMFILTSLWEGLPRVVPQALATGLPVVAYDIAGIEEAVVEGRNGHLVEPGDVEGMVDRLVPIASESELRSAMSQRALDEFDRSFSEDKMITDLEDLYEELLAVGEGGERD